MLNFRLKPYEIDALDKMEAVRLRWLNRDGQEDEPEVVHGQPVTPSLVQALFGKR